MDGGEFVIDEGEYTSESGIIKEGQSITLRVKSSDQFLTEKEATVNVGSQQKSFSVTTIIQDITPDEFNFPKMLNTKVNSYIVSGQILIEGITGYVPISVEGGAFQIDNTSFSDEPTVIQSGQELRVRLLSSSEFETQESATLTVGDSSVNFTVTTGQLDITPDQIVFEPKLDVRQHDFVFSYSEKVSGISSSVPITIHNGEYSINSGGIYTDSDGILELNNSQPLI